MNLRNGKRLAKVGVACLIGTVAAVVAAIPSNAQPAARHADYIVVLDDGLGIQSSGIQARAASVAERFDSAVEHTYTTALHGFSLSLTEKQAAELAREGGVDYVVPDAPVRAMGRQLNPPSWGLDRIDQRDLPYDHRYWYANKAWSVTAYVIDTGVTPHPDFADRIAPGVDIVNGDDDPADGNGHGTFVAGIIGGTEFGVAKKIRVAGVKVLSDTGSGTIADVIAGVDWVTANAARPAVANMSLGGGANQALDDAVRNSISSGVTYTLAAGGSASDASNFSPARVAEALTIGASTPDDCMASHTNYGAVVDMFAPGHEIVGPWPGGGSQTLSGSSFAAPHVAGAVAMYLHANPTASPADVSAALVAASTPDKLCNVPPGTPNRLLYTGP